MNTQEITLDISKQKTIAQVVRIGQGDASGTTIVAKIYDNAQAVALTGKTAMFEMRLPDGKSYVRDSSCTVSGNEITYVVDEEHCASVAGITDEAYFDILDGPSVIYSTARFRVEVLRSAHTDAEAAESWDNAIDELIERGNEWLEDIEENGVPVMGASQRGGAKLGTGLSMSGDVLSVDTTSTGMIPQSEKGSAGGVAELDSNGLVISSQLPSYVDDVLEYAGTSSFPATGEAGKIYVDTTTNLTYRWSGSGYVEISPTVALGETSSTAYRGDRGASAYAHGVTNKGSELATKAIYKFKANTEGHVTEGEQATGADIKSLIGVLGLANGGTSKTTLSEARAYLGSIPAATSPTGASTPGKAAFLGGFALYVGAIVPVLFQEANTYDSDALTLNVNSTGAETIYVGGSPTSASNKLLWDAGTILYFAYSVSGWHYIGNNIDGAYVAASIFDGQALAPASVAATGAVTAMKNNVMYSLGDIGESVSQKVSRGGQGVSSGAGFAEAGSAYNVSRWLYIRSQIDAEHDVTLVADGTGIKFVNEVSGATIWSITA